MALELNLTKHVLISKGFSMEKAYLKVDWIMLRGGTYKKLVKQGIDEDGERIPSILKEFSEVSEVGLSIYADKKARDNYDIPPIHVEVIEFTYDKMEEVLPYTVAYSIIMKDPRFINCKDV